MADRDIEAQLKKLEAETGKTRSQLFKEWFANIAGMRGGNDG